MAVAENPVAPSAYTFENVSEMYEKGTKPVLENSAPEGEVAEEEAKVEEAPTEEAEEAPKEETETEEESEEEKSEEESEEEEEVEEEKKEPEKKVKIFKTKVGDKELEVPEDAEFEIKVDGKLVKAKFSDLQKHYSGTVSIEKKYENFKKEVDSLEVSKQAVEAKEKSLTVEKESLDGVLNSIFEFGKQRDPVKLIQKIVEYSDMDPADFEVNLLNSLTPIVLNWAGLSDEQKNMLVLQRKSVSQSSKLSKYEAEKQSMAQQREMEQTLIKLCRDENIPEQEFVDNFKELARLQEGGHLQIAKIEPQHVVEFSKVRAAQGRVNSALEKVDASLKENSDVVSFLISEVRKEPDMTEADLDEIVQGAFGKGKKAKAEDRLNKKLNDSDAVVTSKKATTSSGSKQERIAGNALSITTPWTFNDF